MAHWSEKYKGLTYSEKAFDCGDLVALVRRQEFGHVIDIPSEHGHNNVGGREKVIRENLEEYVVPTTRPQDGDGILLSIRGRDQHIGVYCELAGVPYVLHNQKKTGVHLTKLRELNRWGYKVEGFYTWI